MLLSLTYVAHHPPQNLVLLMSSYSILRYGTNDANLNFFPWPAETEHNVSAKHISPGMAVHSSSIALGQGWRFSQSEDASAHDFPQKKLSCWAVIMTDDVCMLMTNAKMIMLLYSILFPAIVNHLLDRILESNKVELSGRSWTFGTTKLDFSCGPISIF